MDEQKTQRWDVTVHGQNRRVEVQGSVSRTIRRARQVPEWVSWVAERAKYVWPVMLAPILARGEINRRRKQDALRAERNSVTATATDFEQSGEEPGR